MDHLICNHFSRKAQKSGLINLVQEIWFEKNSSWIFFTKKKVGLYYKSTSFSGWGKVVLQTRIFFWFEEPLLYTFLEKRLQTEWLNEPGK